MEWCFEKADNGRWADQKYLDDFPQRFNSVGIINNRGINLTPFIVYRINTEQGKSVIKKTDGFYIDDTRIILYHYYGFRFYDHNEYDLSCYWMMFDEETINLIYVPYIKECQEAVQTINTYHNLSFQPESLGENQVINYFNLDRTQRGKIYDICIIIGKSDLVKCIALYYSIAQNSEKIHIWICCIDDFSFSVLNKAKLENVTLINSRNFETNELSEFRKTCNEKECISLLRAHCLYYILKNNFSVSCLLYLGSDIYFYRSPVYLMKEFENGSIFLYQKPKTNENSKSNLKTDLIGFRRDKNTMECLINWKYCSNPQHNEESYINTWPSCMPGVKVLEYKYARLQRKHKESMGRALLILKKTKETAEK